MIVSSVQSSLSMASVGFRRPQFSEDLAWLPPWLQQHHAEPSGQCTNDPQTHFEQPFRAFGFVGNITEENEADLLSSREDRYNSCHLFLSGEDNTPISLAQSPANVLQLHLHLSSDLDTPCGQSQILNASKAQFDSSKVLSVQHVENSGCPEDKTFQSKMNCKTSGVKATGTTEINVRSQSFHNEREKGRKHERKSDVKGLKSADINYAVEFSIAASEVLVIHELVKDETTLQCLSTCAILEAALRVKQARMEKLEEAFHCPIDEIDEFDLLSDLDDLTMADAFEDVGLSFNFQDEQDISQVKETPLSGNHETYDCQVEHGEFADPKVGVDNLSRKKHSEDVQAIDMALVSVKKVHDDLALGLNTSGAEGYVDPMLHQLAFVNSNHSSTSLRIDSSMADVPSSQPLADNNLSLAWNSENPKVDTGSSFTSDRFKSRWFGGWSTKEVDTSAQLQQNGAKGIPKFFLRESSFLSESADVAPDENSCVQKHKSRSNVASQSSVPFKGLCDKDNEGLLLSQDEVRSCSPSFVDPLCSIVPCSISSDNAESLVAKNQNDGEVDADKCSSPSSKLGMDNLQKTSDLNDECLYVDRQATPPNSGDCCEARIQRRLSSLKTYSTCLPNHEALNLLFTSECDQALPRFDQNVGSTRHSYESNHKDFGPLRHISDYRVGIDFEQNNENTVSANPLAETTTLERNNEHEPDEAEVQDQPLKERGLPVILNRRTRLRLQAFKNSVYDSTKEENPEQAEVPESLIELQNSKNLPDIPSEHNNAHDTQVPPRKRVRFLEAGVKPKKGPQKLQSSHKSWLTTGAGKRCKYSNPELESQAQDAKGQFATRWVKHRKTLIFQGLQFLLTGLPGKKEKEIEGLIHKYGGVVLSDIPSLNSRGRRHSRSNFMQLPVVLCLKKLQTPKFLYGCAVNTFILKVNWLTDSIAAGSIVPPEKYTILPSQTDVRHSRISKLVCHDDHKCIFERVGIMLHGKQSFCTKLAKIIKHGDGMVFKTLQSLIQSLDSEKISVGAIVAENEGRASRHLRQCASERKIPMMPSSWIIKSLHSGKLIPLPRKKHSSPSFTILVSEFLGSMSDEI